MNAKNGRRNTDFQLAYFLAGSCHTPDGAYALLCELRDEREEALAAGREAAMLAEADRLEQPVGIKSNSEPLRLRLHAEQLRMEREDRQRTALMEAAGRELATINKLIDRIQPHRLFGHLPDHEAHEAAQCEEWRLELIARAQNSMLGQGVVPADLIAAMRQHPAWAGDLRPRLATIMEVGTLHGEAAEALPSASTLPAMLLG